MVAPDLRAVLRNGRLLLQSAAQHAADDPALLVMQVSRRMPFRARVLAGRVLHGAARRIAAGHGLAALGAFMAGDRSAALGLVEESGGHDRSRLCGEVAVLLGRMDLVGPQDPPRIRARAAWARGQMSEAVAILDAAGLGESTYAQRLRSELRILEPGFVLDLPPRRNALPVRSEADGPGVRVLHLLTNSLPHTQSGYSLRSHRILTALRDAGVSSMALTRTGYPVMVGKAAAAREDVVDGIRYRRTLPRRLAALPEGRLQQEALEALRMVEELRPHVLHTTTDYRNALVAQAVSRATGIPWVLEVRGLMEQTWVASHADPDAREQAIQAQKVQLVSAKEAELARAADAVVTLSATMADELASRGVDRAAITIVPNGVDASLLNDHVSPREARAELGIGHAEAVIVGAVSALVDYEGFDVLLRAVEQIVHDETVPGSVRQRLRVVLVGDGVAAPGLAQLARELGIADRVILPGRVPRAQARRWVEAMDLMVIPRVDRAVTRMVTPQKPIEAMALGRPVICSDLPALREVATSANGDTGARLVPAEDADALAAAIVQECERVDGSVTSAAAPIAQERLWGELVRNYLCIYERLRELPQEGTH
ncbi:glycosyltransferase [Brachybacterium timonense]|uniref:glycosyltransferase n=1 Tax=Brachybacterium timonense TaxID=2050896 RepID=UPI001483C896|nr:glycosyltransferase [Brachybacterium timonense]